MSELKLAAEVVICSTVFAIIYGVLFSMAYPLVDVDASLVSLFGVVGLATCVAIKAAWTFLRKKKA